MLYNLRQAYTPALELYEFNDRSLIIDTETVGVGATIEIVEIALGDCEGNVVYHSLVRPVFNGLPRSTKGQRFDRGEFGLAPYWSEVWEQIESLVADKLLIAYNASFDCRAMAAERARHRQRSTERGWRCAMQLVKRVAGTKRNLTLAEVCSRYGLEAGNHRADRDVLATWRLLKTLVERAS
ncbi:MAG TPA: 3'-5' exonuclease [Pyrinomonadaceae bacterium]|nr:3'-5' exonuclease [Pyrinomonadaceae bacterium]